MHFGEGLQRITCEPPEFGPAFAIESVPGSFEILAVCSSGMEPEPSRLRWPDHAWAFATHEGAHRGGAVSRGTMGLARTYDCTACVHAHELTLPWNLVRGPRGGAACAVVWVLRVLGIRTAELQHEIGDDAVEVEPVVKPFLDQREEVAGCAHGHRSSV